MSSTQFGYRIKIMLPIRSAEEAKGQINKLCIYIHITVQEHEEGNFYQQQETESTFQLHNLPRWNSRRPN